MEELHLRGRVLTGYQGYQLFTLVVFPPGFLFSFFIYLRAPMHCVSSLVSPFRFALEVPHVLTSHKSTRAQKRSGRKTELLRRPATKILEINEEVVIRWKHTMHLFLNAEGSGRLLMLAWDLRKRFVSNHKRIS